MEENNIAPDVEVYRVNAADSEGTEPCERNSNQTYYECYSVVGEFGNCPGDESYTSAYDILTSVFHTVSPISRHGR